MGRRTSGLLITGLIPESGTRPSVCVTVVFYLKAKGKKRQIGWFPGSYVKVLGPGGGSRQSSSRTTPIPFDEIAEMPMMAAPIYSDTKGT